MEKNMRIHAFCCAIALVFLSLLVNLLHDVIPPTYETLRWASRPLLFSAFAFGVGFVGVWAGLEITRASLQELAIAFTAVLIQAGPATLLAVVSFMYALAVAPSVKQWVRRRQ